MNAKDSRRTANILALRRAILDNQENPQPGRFAALRVELTRLEQAEVEAAQGVEDAPFEMMNGQLLA